MFRKVYLVVECGDDQQKEEVQNVMNDISNMRILTGDRLLAMYPFFKKNQRELASLFGMIAKNGIRSLFSMQGAMLLKSLTKK